MGQKCGEPGSVAPDRPANFNARAGPSIRFARIRSFAPARREPHHGNFVRSDPSANTSPNVSPAGTGRVRVIRSTPSAGRVVHSPWAP